MNDSCTQLRRRLVTHSTFNMRTGERKEGRKEWETAACAAPLFGDAERAAGKCRSCADGWTHPNNYPVESSK